MNSLFGGVPSTIINHHQPSSTIISHHQPSSTIISHHQPSSTIINHHQPVFFFKYNLGWHDLQLETVDRPRKKCSVHYIRCFNPNQAKAKGWLSEWKWWHFHPCIHIYIYIYLFIYLFIYYLFVYLFIYMYTPEIQHGTACYSWGVYIYIVCVCVDGLYIHCMYTL